MKKETKNFNYSLKDKLFPTNFLNKVGAKTKINFMRKIIYSLVLTAMLFQTESCQPEEVEAGVETLGADFVGYGEAISSCLEGGGEICPPCCHAFATAMGMLASGNNGAQRSISSNRGLNKTTEIEILLPEQYKLTNNPYECDGVTHNKVLFYLLKSQSEMQIRNNVLEDQTLLDRIASTYVDCNPKFAIYKNQIANHLHQNVTIDIYNAQIKKYENITQSQLFSTTRISTDNVKYFQEVYYELMTIKSNYPNDTRRAMDFINSKINNNLNNTGTLNKDQIIRASSLTLLKHSYYYWVN